MSKNNAYTQKTEMESVKISGSEIERIKCQNYIVLTERIASTDENYTIHDELIKCLNTWLKKTVADMTE